MFLHIASAARKASRGEIVGRLKWRRGIVWRFYLQPAMRAFLLLPPQQQQKKKIKGNEEMRRNMAAAIIRAGISAKSGRDD